MPRINVAMAASLEPARLALRDLSGTVSDVKNSFSSWDNCMNAAYCKWPVIIAIIIAGLIVLSVISCIVRVACCGMSCCCSCFSCLKCCGNCCGCCDPPNGRPHKHLDEPYNDPNQGYRAPPPMMTGGVGVASAYEPPKYAQFEVGPSGLALEPKRVNEDALPPMPSWDTAGKKRVVTEEEGNTMEMGVLDPKTGQQVPLMSGANAISRTGSPAISPVHSPYADRPGMNDEHGYMGSGAIPPGGMGPGGMGLGRGMGPGAMGHGDIGAEAMGAGALSGAALGVGATAMGGRGHDPYRRNDPYGSNDPYARNGPSDRNGFGGPNDRGGFNGPPNDRYGPSSQAVSPIDGPGRGQGYSNQFPPGAYPPNDNRPGNFGAGVAAARAYDRGGLPRQPPNRQNSQDANRPLMAPSPQRPYPDSSTLASFHSEPTVPFPIEPTIPFTDSPRGPPGRMASPSNNDSGFDFGDRGPGPQSMHYGGGNGNGNGRRPSAPGGGGGGSYAGSTAPPSYASRSPPPPLQQQGGYGGGGSGRYQSYTAPERPAMGRAPPSSEGRRRQAEPWDGV